MAAVQVGVLPGGLAGAGVVEGRWALEQVADAGLDHVGTGDHVSFHTGWGDDGLVRAASLVSLHPTLPVYLGVYLLVLRHPVLVARQLASLAQLAPGRIVCGVGIGGEDRHEIEICGVDPRTRGRRMEACLSALRELLSGEPVSFTSEFFSFRDALISPAPSPAIPLIVGGRSEAAVRRAGRLGDGWLGIWVSPKRFALAAEQAAEEAEAAGRGEVAWQHGMQVWCGLGSSRAGAREAVASAMEGLYQLPFETFERYTPYGTPEDVAAFLAPYVEAGCTSFNLIPQGEDPVAVLEAAGEVKRLLSR